MGDRPGGYADAAQALRGPAGVVIPVFVPEGVARDVAAAALGETARALAGELGATLAVSPVNRGKLHALRLGAAPLLEDRRIRYLALIDQDGDHFPNDLPNFLRAARHAEAATGEANLLVIGSRASRHRPMGFLRGELEGLADRVLLDALHYDAARRGRPLPLEFATALDEFPDFHSGYKVLTRPAAGAALLGEPDLAGERAPSVEDLASAHTERSGGISVFDQRRDSSTALRSARNDPGSRGALRHGEPAHAGVADDAYYRHAVEAVLTVEAILAGARLVSVRRSTFNRQPISAFGLLDRRRLAADMIVWPCRRLGVAAAFVDQWFRNHAPRLLLSTLAPEGAEELRAIHALVMQGMDPAFDPASAPPLLGPLSV